MTAHKHLLSSIAVGAIVLTLAACGGTGGTLGTVPPVAETPVASADPGGPDLTPDASATPSQPASPVPSSDPSASSAPTTGPTTSPAGTMIVRTYYIMEGTPGVEGLVPELAEVPESVAVAKSAMTALLAGRLPALGQSNNTAIPLGTELLGLTIKNTVATVDLSTEFDSGGGSASLQYRLAQVVYTLTQFSTVKSVVFQIEGQTVTVFGSEGIGLDGPVGRADFNDQLPSMFVDRPAYGAAFGNPGRVSGTANVFEATFRMTLLDASGATLVDRQVMATCGTGCRGTFDVTVPYTVGKAQWGTLRVYDPSEKDGTPQDIRDYPVWLTPGG